MNDNVDNVDNVFVSLTSIFKNQYILLKTLESIKLQTVKPNKCYIFLSEEPFLLDTGFPNKTITNIDLMNFIKSNSMFEIRWGENEGPYRKLIPLLKEKWNDDCIIITLDDDTVYDNMLIENYINDYHKYDCCINYRGFTLKFNNLENINYNNKNTLIKLNLYNFFTGKGGVLYHPKFFKNTKTNDLIFNKELYLKDFSKCDDIWFNFIRIANNVNCYIDTKQYMLKDNTNFDSSLYSKYNVNHNTKNIQKIIELLTNLGYLKN
jgi:hypothetical protein